MLRNARRERRHWYIEPTPHYYWYDGNRIISAGPDSIAAATTAAASARAGRRRRSDRCGRAGECALSADYAQGLRPTTTEV